MRSYFVGFSIRTLFSQIMSGDSLREVGKIVHGWDRELVSFTTTLHMPDTAVQPKHKALLLGATFLMVGFIKDLI